MSRLPTGTVTFLFTDIEGSTTLVQELGDERYADLLRQHRRLARAAFGESGGREVDTQGDAFFVAFQSAKDAVVAAVSVQQVLHSYPWPSGRALQVRMGLHTGEPIETGEAYVGLDVVRAARICAAGHGGQVLLSQTTHDLVKHELPAGLHLRDLGEHRLKDLQRPERVYQLLHPDLPDIALPLRSLSTLPNNLPVQLTSFIGRTREMAEVRALLVSTRLLTLTGTGGSGKTRLALQAAADLLDDFPDGVWLVDLAPLSDPALVGQAVATVLHVREEPQRPLTQTLAEFTRARRLLLLLDNCEHVVDACAHLAQVLLAASPDLRILATSREPLGIPGEQRYLVPPLSVPAGAGAAPGVLVESEAVRLFVERAASRQLGFKLTDANAQLVTQICRALDGLPLAIELAAARVGILPIADIAARLDRRLDLLTGGSRTAERRQQTLRALLDWSHDLLTEPERTLFRRLAVFSGGFTLQAAEAVCTDGIPRESILDLVGSLINKSLLVTVEEPVAVRYRMLETVREYGLDKLVEYGELDGARAKHREWFVWLAEQAEPGLLVHDESALNRMESEHDNLRAAFDDAVTSTHAESALRLAVSIASLWMVRGYWTEGRQRLETSLAAARSAGAARRGTGFYMMGVLAMYQGDYDRAQVFAEESLTLRRRLGDTAGIARSLATLGNLAYQRGNYSTARELHEESLASARQSGYQLAEASALLNLGIVADHMGDYRQATALCQEALALFRQLEYRLGLAATLSMLGTLASDQGNYEEAAPLVEEALAIQRHLRDRRGTAASLSHLGRIARERGEFARARALYEEALAVARETGNRTRIAMLLTSLGRVAWHQGQRGEAAARFKESLQMRIVLGDQVGIAEAMEGLAAVTTDTAQSVLLLAAAASLRDALLAPIAPSDRQAHDRLISERKNELGEAAFERAWNRGSAATAEDVARLVLEM